MFLRFRQLIGWISTYCMRAGLFAIACGLVLFLLFMGPYLLYMAVFGNLSNWVGIGQIADNLILGGVGLAFTVALLSSLDAVGEFLVFIGTYKDKTLKDAEKELMQNASVAPIASKNLEPK